MFLCGSNILCVMVSNAMKIRANSFLYTSELINSARYNQCEDLCSFNLESSPDKELIDQSNDVSGINFIDFYLQGTSAN